MKYATKKIDETIPRNGGLRQIIHRGTQYNDGNVFDSDLSEYKYFKWKILDTHNAEREYTTYYNDTYSGTIDDKGNVSLTKHAGGSSTSTYKITSHDFYRDVKDHKHAELFKKWQMFDYKFRELLPIVCFVVGGVMFLFIVANWIIKIYNIESAFHLVQTFMTIGSIGIAIAFLGGFYLLMNHWNIRTILMRLVTLPLKIKALKYRDKSR